jgi:hypothetical protein
MSLLTTLKERWVAKSPKFFQQLTNIAIALGSAATAVWMANSGLSLDLHQPVLDVCKYIIAFCAAVGLTSKLTKQ